MICYDNSLLVQLQIFELQSEESLTDLHTVDRRSHIINNQIQIIILVQSSLPYIGNCNSL